MAALVRDYLNTALGRLRSGEDALGERLLVLSDGVDVEGTEGDVLGLDRHGLAVVLVAVAEPDGRLPEALADHLARIATLSEVELARMADSGPTDLRKRHTERFSLDGAAPPLNADQRVLLLVGREPSDDWWASAEAELGSRLDGVYLVSDEAPERLRSARGDRAPRGPLAAWLGSRWATAAAAALVAALVAVALTGGFDGEEEAQLPVVEGFVSTVTAGVPGDATHTQWTGQHHVVKTSDDRLHVLYASAGRLHVVSDHANGGRTWNESVAIPSIRTTGYSAAADAEDRLLLAYTDDEALRFTTLTRSGTGWEPGETLVLDPASSSRVVDIAWDPAAEVAHVVWAAADGAGERPHWAAVEPGAAPRVVQSEPLAPAGEGGTVLVSIVPLPDSGVLAAYRSAGRSGFFSRTARTSGGELEWGPEETVASDTNFGAVSLVADRRGVAHLALRDDVRPSLLYFRRPAGEGWQEAEVAVAAPASEEVDFPALSVDESSGLVHLFFQNAVLDPSPQIRVLVRDPAAGWEGSFQLINPDALPEGANFPISTGTVTGSASVIWTKKGPIPELQIVRFLAP
jgi:hypothetical protein